MRKWIPAAFLVAGLVFSLVVYSRLPATMAIHWNLRGEPDGFGSRMLGAFIIPAVALSIWLVMRFIPFIDPRRANIEKFREAFDVLLTTIVGVLMVIHVAMLGYALGWPVSVARVAPIAVGTLFVVLGNLLPRFRSNFFFGIRTPWTLSSEQVWMKTHRLGGYLMVLSGLVIIATAFFHSAAFFHVALGVVGAMAAATIVYSYVLWRSETRHASAVGPRHGSST